MQMVVGLVGCSNILSLAFKLLKQFKSHMGFLNSSWMSMWSIESLIHCVLIWVSLLLSSVDVICLRMLHPVQDVIAEVPGELFTTFSENVALALSMQASDAEIRLRCISLFCSNKLCLLQTQYESNGDWIFVSILPVDFRSQWFIAGLGHMYLMLQYLFSLRLMSQRGISSCHLKKVSVSLPLYPCPVSLDA